jgi:flagellar hook protein FlgE
MMRAMYSAISGLKANQTMMDVVANNLANVNTVAYKSSRVTFRDMLSEMSRAGAAQSTTGGYAGANSNQIGLGVTVGSIDKLMGSGATQSTGSPTDVMIAGEGWFRVGQATTAPAATPGTTLGTFATVNYTRAGNFTTNNNGYLTTADGFYVIGKSVIGGAGPTAGSPDTTDAYINIPKGATDTQIGPNGAVSFSPPAGYVVPTGQYADPGTGRIVAGYLSLSTFQNQAGLDKVGNNRYAVSASSGTATNNVPGLNGFGTTNSSQLEMSNVDMATEFTSMITAQRGFQANSRVITTGDSMLEELVNLKR